MTARQLRIHLLGPLEVLDGEESLELPPSKKARALLAYLVATGRQHSRSALCDLFWQEVNDPRAGLRWALSKLRSVVDDDRNARIVTSRDRVGLALDGADVDLQRVRAAVPGDPSQAPVEALKRAAAAFRGEFLSGLDLYGCHQYEAWCLGMREHLRSLHVSIHAGLVGRLRGEPEAALPHALARLELDPFAEDAYIAAMELLGELGRMDRALELDARCRHMLADHLGAPPSGELDAARRRLKSPSRRGSSGEGSPVGDAGEAYDLSVILSGLPEPENLPAVGTDEPSLVGRTTEMETLSELLGRSVEDGDCGAALVCGEPGIGKTRVLRELVQEVRAQGGWALSGPVFESEEVRPYGPWVDMLRRLPAPVLEWTSGDKLSGLLVPQRSESPSTGAAERAQLFQAVADLLREMVEERTPGVVVLDDVQWLDPSSAALLHYLARTLGSVPLAFVLAARDEEIDGGSSVARVLRSLDGAGRLHRLRLARLDASETEALVRAFDTTLDSARVFTTSEGNPFFTLAVAASLKEGVDRMPATIEGELSDRFDRLDPPALSLLPWAAALGRAFDMPTLLQVVDQPAPEVVDAVGSLERRGILRATGEDRYDFSHSLLRQAAYRRPSQPARRAIHRSIARALDAVDRSEGRMPGAVAHHAERGGLPGLSARAAIEAADDALWVCAFDEAAELARRGLEQVAALPDEARIPLEMKLLRIHTFRSMEHRRPEELEGRARTLTEEAREAGLIDTVATGHALLMELEYQRGAFDEAHQSSVRSAEAGREGEPLTAIRSLAETAACLLILDQAPEDAHRLASEAFRLADEHGVEMDVTALASALLAHHQGHLDAAHGGFGEVIRLGRRARDRWWECPAMCRMIMVDLDRSDPQGALSRAREAEELAERMNDEEEAAFARGLGAVASWLLAVSRDKADPDAGPPPDMDEPLEELRTLDSLWKIGHVQAYAAEVELLRGRSGAARARAEATLHSARTLGRPSLLALARGLLAETAAMEGDPDEAERQLASPEVTRPYHSLSHRARTVLGRARAALP